MFQTSLSRLLAGLAVGGSLLLTVACAPTTDGSSNGNPYGTGTTKKDAGTTNTNPGTDGGLSYIDGGTAGDTGLVVATASTADEYALNINVTSNSHTSWATKGNEAVILEVSGSYRGFISHLVLTQGADGANYGVALGALSAGEQVSVKVSGLSAKAADPTVTVNAATLTSATELGAAGEGLKNAPILKWPNAKAFDDLPVVLGWSAAKKHYSVVYTNENGGTPVSCGGGAHGMRSEIARWGRGSDIEDVYNYGGTTPSWDACTGRGSPVANSGLHFEAAHPVFYYGSGHNTLYSSRAGYGQACGTGSEEMADGNLYGWNFNSPGYDSALDGAYALTIRLLPQDLDALGYADHPGLVETLMDKNPWVYRLTDAELHREGKVDGDLVKNFNQYLYTTLHTDDVGGSGDATCSFPYFVHGGFKLHVWTKDIEEYDSAQLTADYVSTGSDFKRVAIPLAKVYAATDVLEFDFDAYNNDGIYLQEYGDTFTVSAVGDNSAQLNYVHSGNQALNVYVDDNSSACTAGVNSTGPEKINYKCVGSFYKFPATPNP